MGLKDDLHRFQEVGEERREDLADFIEHGDLGGSREGRIRIPIKIVDLPEFRYDRLDVGGVGQGDAEVGDPIEDPALQPGDDDAEGEPGEESGEHGYYEMDPEEFAEQLDDELGLDLEPKGKAVRTVEEDAFTDVARVGPRSTLDVEFLFREGLKRKLATAFDEDLVREALRVEGWGPEEVFRWARERKMPVSLGWIEAQSVDEPDRWESVEAMEAGVGTVDPARRARRVASGRLPLRREDERFRHPEVREERERNVVVVNIRDVSGSMDEGKRDLVERTFAPLDWYLQGKYDTAEFLYVAHDTEAWRVERRDFFGLRSSGGTRISSAYELAEEALEDAYPWERWNRYVFAAGDSENSAKDTTERVIPLIESIDANLHAYVETRPEDGRGRAAHADAVDEHFEGADDVVVVRVNDPTEVVGAIETILVTEAGDE